MWRTTGLPLRRQAARTISIHVLRVEDDVVGFFDCPGYIDFNPRPPCGGRPTSSGHWTSWRVFQSTSSVWRTTSTRTSRLWTTADFNPRPPCGGRRQLCEEFNHAIQNFNPRPPCGGRLGGWRSSGIGSIFQSTSSVWRTTEPQTFDFAFIEISIHVLRVEDDNILSVHRRFLTISIHVLRVEDDKVF